MKERMVLVGLVTSISLVVWAGCGGSKSSGTTATGTGATGSTSTTHTSSVSTGTGAGGMGTGGTATNPFECTVPSTPPSGGSCVTVGAMNDAGTGIQCNPVTNAGCSATDECDTNADSTTMMLVGFVCYPPMGTPAAVCAACDDQNGPTCAGGTTCFPFSSTQAVCAHYCCTDADCGSGKCTTMGTSGALFAPLASSLGVCTAM